jgi:hypothetical protein
MPSIAFARTVRGAIGITLVALGGVLTAMNFDVLEPVPIVRFWPMILVVLGILGLTKTNPDKPLEGYWLLVIGLWLQVSLLELWGLGFRETWPMLVIAWGVSLLLREGTARGGATANPAAPDFAPRQNP